jgi:predicted amidohydrolase
MRLRVGLGQIRCEKGDWVGNLATVEQYMARAHDAGCDVVVFPEMSLSGYCDPRKFPEAVVGLESEWVRRFVELSGRYGVAASAGFIEENGEGGKPFITQVMAQNGEIAGVYRKVHAVDEEAEWFSPGTDTPVFRLRTPGGDVTCALAVCADSDRADLFAEWARKGARIILHSSAPGLYTRRTDEASWWDGYNWYRGYLAKSLPGYAKEHGLHIVVATQTGSTVDEDFPGGSYVFGPNGECKAAIGDFSEGLLVWDVAIDPGVEAA